MTTESPEKARAEKQALVDRAIAYMDATPADDLAELFTRLGLKKEFRQTPERLRDVLAAAGRGPGGQVGPFKAAQQLLHAAGLYQYPATAPTAARCEVVDQIIEWTTPDGTLQIEPGDLILDTGNLEKVTLVEFTRTGNIRYELDKVPGPAFVAPDDLVAVRRYRETIIEEGTGRG